jgi:hypothetical protein
MAEKLTPAQIQILIQFLQSMFQQVVGQIHLDLMAHLAAIETLKRAHPDRALIIDAVLAAARTDAAVRDSSQRQCRATLEKLVQQVHECARGAETLEQMIQDLKQTKWN